MNDSTQVGSAPSDPLADQRDGSLFGPESVTWRVHADPLMGVAGLRAILLQVLHPVVMGAIDLHSDYRDDPWRRLHRLTEFITLTTFGSTAEAMLHGSRVRAVHARIRGRTPGGIDYTADDPQLLAWVHCCQVASFLEIVTRGGVRLSGAEQDAYIAEQVRAAMLIGLEPDEVPHDRARLLDYFRVIRPLLACSPGARRAAALIVRAADAGCRPEGPGAAVLPSWVPVAGLAFAALPPWARRLYALADPPGAAGLSDAATTTALRTLRASL
jgi:uncharacterized protein (DUF2236 family)